MKTNSIWMGFDIETTTGPILQPLRIHSWSDKKFKTSSPDVPFHYRADALFGLSLVHLNQNLKTPFSSPEMNFSFAHSAWKALEPHFELYQRTQPRVNALRKKMTPVDSGLCDRFAQQFNDVLASTMKTSVTDLAELTALIGVIDDLEVKMNAPILFNFHLAFKPEFVEKLHHVHSMLFHLRALIASDYNAYIQDVTFEALRVDSISDYSPKSEYITNDSMIYWSILRLQNELSEGNLQKLKAITNQYSHNAVCLIESLPRQFLQNMPAQEMENSLYLAQMDWLLGTEAGLLFKIREEIYGIVEGYQHVFWHDLEGKPYVPAHRLEVNCKLTEKDLARPNVA